MSEAAAAAMPPEQLQIVVVDVSAARQDMARDAADARLNAETQAGGGVMGLARRIWKGSIAHEYYRQKYTHEAQGQIDETQNLFINEDGSPAAEASLGAVVERFASDYDEVIHTEAGERRNLLDDPTDPAANNIKTSIRELLRAFADDDLDDGNFEEEKNRVLKDLAAENPDLLGPGLLYADNLLEIAQNVKAAAAHGRGVQEILDDAQFTVGEAKMGARTEARFNATDKLIDKLHSTAPGSLVNETTIATAAAIMACAGKFMTQKTIGAAAKVTGVFGLGGAILGGLRESKRVKEERSLHSREMAVGKEYQPGAKRREELETARYETQSATELAAALRQGLDDTGRLADVEPDEFLGLVGLLGDVTMRNRLSDTQNIDLIDFSDVTSVETERLDLDLARIQVQEALRERFDEKGPDWIEATVDVHDFDELLDLTMATYEASLDQGIQERDRVFRKIHRDHVIKAAIIGGVIGAGIAVGTQELMAHLPGVGDQFVGLGEQPTAGQDGEVHKTLLNGIFNHDQAPHVEVANHVQHLGAKVDVGLPEGYQVKATSTNVWEVLNHDGKVQGHVKLGDNGLMTPESKQELAALGFKFESGTTPIELSGQTHDTIISGQHFVLPKEYNLHETTPGHWDIVDAQGAVSGNFVVDENGQVSYGSIAGLQAAGIHFDTAHQMISENTTTHVSAGDFVQNHLDQTRQVHRVLWYNNDTPQYDLNELRTYAGGEGGSWYDQQGNVVLDVTHMIPEGGSFAGNQSIDPFDVAHAGKLSLAVSASRDTQNNVFDFNFTTTPDGRTLATIPPGNAAHQLFEMNGDQRVFKGGFFEVMQNTGQHDQFGEQVKVVGTYVGTNQSPDFTDVIHTSHDLTTTKITMPPITGSFEHATLTEFIDTPETYEAVPIIPIRSRAGLEKASHQERQYYGYGAVSPEEILAHETDRSPRLRRDPAAELDLQEELSWYKKLLKRNRGRDYVEDVERRIASTPELSNLPSSTKAIVCIPVGAAGEADNIYSTLSLYAQQQGDVTGQTTVLLHVNWIDDQMGNPTEQAKIQKTLAEIERARADFPDLKIASFTSEWKREEITRQGGVIGEVVRRLYDTALLIVDDAVRRGAIADDSDVLIVRNDADTKGMSSRYLRNVIDAADKSDGRVDAFTGGNRWETSRHRDFPGFGVVSNFTEVMYSLSARRSSDARLATKGNNTAIKASSLAGIGSIGFGAYVGVGSDDLELGDRVYAARTSKPQPQRGILSRGAQRILYGRGGKPRARTTAGSAGYGGANTGSSSVRPVSYVRGAQMDTSSDRLLNLYRAGESISGAWDAFDRGGHRGRSVVPDGVSLIDADDMDDFDSVVKRVEYNISDVATNWYRDPAKVQAGLRFVFPKQTKDGKPVYDLRWHNGDCEFTLTDAGRDWFQSRLERDQRGRFDPFGNRVRRNLYQETRRGAKKQPNTNRPRFVAPRA